MTWFFELLEKADPATGFACVMAGAILTALIRGYPILRKMGLESDGQAAVRSDSRISKLEDRVQQLTNQVAVLGAALGEAMGHLPDSARDRAAAALRQAFPVAPNTAEFEALLRELKKSGGGK